MMPWPWLRRGALAASLLGMAGSPSALTVKTGELVFLPGTTPIGELQLQGGVVGLNGDVLLNQPIFLEAGRIVAFADTLPTRRTQLALKAPTLLTGAVDLDGNFPGDLQALTTTNHDLLLQTGAGALRLLTLSNFINLGTYQIDNDLGIVYRDVWAALEHATPGIEHFVNKGNFNKSGGAGTSIIDMALDNVGGQVLAMSGTLRLQTGGDHAGGSFVAFTNAALELGGPHGLSGGNDFQGRISVIDGGTLQLNRASLLSVSPGNGAPGSALTVAAGGHLLTHAELSIQSDGTLRNEGTMLAGDGAVTTVYGVFDNAGTVQHGGSSRLDVFGSLHNRSGATLAIGSAGPAGPVSLQHYGSIVNDAGGVVTLDGAANSVAGASLANKGSLVQAGSWFLDGQVLNGSTGVIRFKDTSTVVGSGSLDNAGTVFIESGASVSLASVRQTGGLLSLDGTLDTQAGNVTIEGGILNGSGRIQGNLVAGGATINPGDPPKIYPGHSPGHLSVSGSFQLLAGATLQLQIERLADGSLAWDQLSAGQIILGDGSRVELVIGSGAATGAWQTLALLDCGSCSFGNGVSFAIDGAPGSNVQLSSQGLALSLAPSAVPEPQAWVLLLIGRLWLNSALVRRPKPLTWPLPPASSPKTFSPPTSGAG